MSAGGLVRRGRWRRARSSHSSHSLIFLNPAGIWKGRNGNAPQRFTALPQAPGRTRSGHRTAPPRVITSGTMAPKVLPMSPVYCVTHVSFVHSPTKDGGGNRAAIRATNPWGKCPARAQTARIGARVVPRFVRGAFTTGCQGHATRSRVIWETRICPERRTVSGSRAPRTRRRVPAKARERARSVRSPAARRPSESSGSPVAP